MPEFFDIEYREYTTEGRFITKSGFLTRPSIIREDIETILDPDLTAGMESYYKSQGIISAEENLKPMWNTNVVVRCPKTGRFTKWKY